MRGPCHWSLNLTQRLFPMTLITRAAVLLLASAGLFTSCKRETKIPVLVVEPDAREIGVTSGQVFTFTMKARSDNSTLSRLLITSKRGNGFTVTVVDSALTGKTFNWNWEFQVAHASAAYDELYTFTLYDAAGESMSTTRTLYVTLTETLLQETSGHLFYSRNSAVHPESAFDVEDRVQVIYTADSTRRDIQDNPAGPGEVLSKSWISPAGGRFVRFNDFDYANATDIGLRNAFNSGVPVEQIDNLVVGDIILTKLGSQPANTGYYAALRINGIVDEAVTADNDRYQFNMKWASFTE